MKEILFRGKHIVNGRWVQGFYFERKNTEGKIIEAVIIEDMYQQVSNGMRYMRSDLHKECFRVDPETVGQYTGLKDKNGTKIFEGDIVEYNDERGIIEYDEDDGMYYAKIEFTLYDFSTIDSRWLEVIGNIHDTPELLEGGADDE